MMEGARLVRENNVDLILGVGGGSFIDCSRLSLYLPIAMVTLGKNIGLTLKR